MKTLFDHCVPKRFRRTLGTHEVRTAGEMGWENLRNGRLLSAAAQRFDVLLMVDRNIKYQQNMATLPIAVVVIVVPNNRLAELIPLAAAVENALKNIPPRTLVEVVGPV